MPERAVLGWVCWEQYCVDLGIDVDHVNKHSVVIIVSFKEWRIELETDFARYFAYM